MASSVVLTPKPTQLLLSNSGRGFFNVVENPTTNDDHLKTQDQVYVHPMVKRSASALSTRSLEMCTESLGTETGSESSDELIRWERLAGLQRSKSDRKMVMSHRRGGGGGFPPPLTSISGSDGTVKVRPHRENGRLVIKAVSVSNCGTKFEAQRTNGRLSLSLLRDCCVNVETGRAEMKNVGGGEETDVELWEMDGYRRKVRSPKRKSGVPKSSEKSTEFALTKCKGGGNGNKGMGNWSLFRVVIS